MKIRNGFVSNSSSSSFVIRGLTIPTKELIEILDIKIEDSTIDKCELDYYVAYESESIKVKELSKDNLELQTIRSFFDGKESGEIIIGQHLGHGHDGEVCEIEEPNDTDIIDRLKKHKIPITKPLRTYMQYISNDNY